MAKLTFEYTKDDMDETNREISGCSLDVPNDMSIQEYKIVCMRIAATLGYNPKRINELFGDLVFGNEKPDELKELLKSVNISQNTDEG